MIARWNEWFSLWKVARDSVFVRPMDDEAGRQTSERDIETDEAAILMNRNGMYRALKLESCLFFFFSIKLQSQFNRAMIKWSGSTLALARLPLTSARVRCIYNISTQMKSFVWFLRHIRFLCFVVWCGLVWYCVVLCYVDFSFPLFRVFFLSLFSLRMRFYTQNVVVKFASRMNGIEPFN